MWRRPFSNETTTVKAYMAKRGRQATEGYVPLIYRPGGLAEADVFEIVAEVDGQRKKAWKFLMRQLERELFRAGGRRVAGPLSGVGPAQRLGEKDVDAGDTRFLRRANEPQASQPLAQRSARIGVLLGLIGGRAAALVQGSSRGFCRGLADVKL